MESNGHAIWCHDIQKHYGEGETRIDALRGVDFKARFGELSFLVGPSGCGKTTLLCVIAGLLDRSGGDLTVLGQNLDGLSDGDRVLFRRKNLGFVFQQYNLLPALTAAENVAVPLPRPRFRAKRRWIAPGPSCRGSGSKDASRRFPPSFPAASNNASRSPGLSFTSRGSSYATSQRRPWTMRRVRP